MAGHMGVEQNVGMASVPCGMQQDVSCARLTDRCRVMCQMRNVHDGIFKLSTETCWYRPSGEPHYFPQTVLSRAPGSGIQNATSGAMECGATARQGRQTAQLNPQSVLSAGLSQGHRHTSQHFIPDFQAGTRQPMVRSMSTTYCTPEERKIAAQPSPRAYSVEMSYLPESLRLPPAVLQRSRTASLTEEAGRMNMTPSRVNNVADRYTLPRFGLQTSERSLVFAPPATTWAINQSCDLRNHDTGSLLTQTPTPVPQEGSHAAAYVTRSTAQIFPGEYRDSRPTIHAPRAPISSTTSYGHSARLAFASWFNSSTVLGSQRSEGTCLAPQSTASTSSDHRDSHDEGRPASSATSTPETTSEDTISVVRLNETSAQQESSSTARALRSRRRALRRRLSTGTLSYDELLELQEIVGAVNKGLSLKEIELLPEESYQPKAAKCRECLICCTEYEESEMLRRLPCWHAFHSSCIDKWLQSRNTCPLCRFEVNQVVELYPGQSASSSSFPPTNVVNMVSPIVDIDQIVFPCSTTSVDAKTESS